MKPNTKRPFDVEPSNGICNKSVSLQRRSHISTKVNRTLCWGAQAVYFFFVKVYDNAIIDVTSEENPIININASKVVIRTPPLFPERALMERKKLCDRL